MSGLSPRRLAAPVAFALLAALVPAVAAPPAAAAKPAVVDPAVTANLADDGRATFVVRLADRADLGPARAKKSHADKATAAHAALTGHAREGQKGLRDLLDAERAGYQSFWITNAMRVVGDAGLVERIAARPEVASIEPERVYRLPETSADSAAAVTAAAVEWGVANIRAPQVWSEYGTTGAGIVVGGIDTGVQFDHPALAATYRGNLGGGRYSHDYNFFDPTGVCPSAAPCDNAGHGTHTMGTIAGADGIGVAPGVRWMAAKGCEDDSCSESSLLLAGQWMLAPTDNTGANPRPELAPHVINNSWGGGRGSTWYSDIINAWKAAGIFPVFSVGNSGPACGTADSPGDGAGVYAVGSYQSNNAISSFSSRGPAVNGETKPNIAAPGSNVRSAMPGNNYGTMNGTSMAAPHVTGAVALLWSAAPSLVGDLAATENLLNATAIDTANLTCGGTAANNNVFGEGRLDAYAAVAAAPRADTGVVSGTVTAPGTGAAIANATVSAGGRSVLTNADGRYELYLSAGTYALRVNAYGYQRSDEVQVEIVAKATVTRDVALRAAPFALGQRAGFRRAGTAAGRGDRACLG